MSKTSVIITAGGLGKRMQSVLPKQFIQVNDKPILMYTIERFYHFDPKSQLIVVLPDEWLDYWENLLVEYDFKIPHRIVEGGQERYHSIKNALQHCTGDIIAVHDGVRPLVSEDTIKGCLKSARENSTAVPVLPITESIRKKDGETTVAVSRKNYMIVQTPQCFRQEVIRKAYEQPFNELITDDASLVESMGVEITTVSGNEENIKITSQSDLKYAELLLK